MRIFLLIMVLAAVFSTPVFGQDTNTSVWVENWDNGWQNRWVPIGNAHSCSYTQDGILIQDCQSHAFQSIDRFPIYQRLEFSGTIFTQPGQNSSNLNDLAHHTLIGADDGPDGEYCGLYIAYDESTNQDKVFRMSYPYVTEIGYVKHQVHQVTILWEPKGDRSGFGIRRQKGTCSYYVDDELLFSHNYGFMLTDVALWQGASSVSPGESNDGSSSYAEHGPITLIVGG